MIFMLFQITVRQTFVRQAIIFKEISERRISDPMWGAPRYWPLCGEFTGDPQKWPVTRKCFHLMTSQFSKNFPVSAQERLKENYLWKQNTTVYYSLAAMMAKQQ